MGKEVTLRVVFTEHEAVTALREATEGYVERTNNPIHEGPDAEKARKLAEYTKTVRGCLSGKGRDAVVGLVETLSGLTLPPVRDGDAVGFQGEVVVPLDNRNGHDYSNHLPVLVVNGYRAYDAQGRYGNSLPLDHFDTQMRLPTPEEVEWFWASLHKAAGADVGGCVKRFTDRAKKYNGM